MRKLLASLITIFCLFILYTISHSTIQTDSEKNFVKTLRNCIQNINLNQPKIKRIPENLIIAQAIVESDFGTSRFAKEGNNILGIKTWDLSDKDILPLNQPKEIIWRIKHFNTKCECVSYYFNILNNSEYFKDFRNTRKITKDPLILVEHLGKYATNKNYILHVKEFIVELNKGVYDEK